jgi:hypothetical protein
MSLSTFSTRCRAIALRALLACGLLFVQGAAFAAIALFTAPNGLDNVEGDSASTLPFGDSSACTNGFRYQQIINGDQGLFGTISSLAFRLDGGAAAVGPLIYGNTTITVSSTDQSASTMSPNFDENLGLDRQVVWSGDLEIAAGTEAGTNPFDIQLLDTGGFRFGDEGDNLLIDITVEDCPPGAAFFLDAVSSDADVQGLFSGDRDSDSGSFEQGLVAELTASTPGVVAPLYSCAASGGGGDEVNRGIILEDFPTDGLGRVSLTYSADQTGTYAVELIARQERYDGAIIGAETVAFTINDTAEQTTQTFDFRNAPVGPGEDVTLTHRIRSQPAGSQLFYDLGSGECENIEQTNGTTPPQDTFRNDRVAIDVTISDPGGRFRGLGGNWTVVDRTAEGLMIDVTDQDQLVVIWFTYDDDGTQQWLVGSTGEFPDNDIGFDLLKGSGPTFVQIRQDGFDNSLIDLETWGRMYIRFTSCDTATVRFESNDHGSGEFEIQRIYETEEDFCR